MKVYNQLKIIFIFLLFFALFPTFSFCQTTIKNNSFKKYWSVNLNAGANLFWGDLRQYDYYPVTNYENEWQLGYGIILNWQISPVFGLRGQLLNGKLSGTRRQINRYFTADIFEYNLNTTVNFSNLFFHYKPKRLFTVYGTVGVGLSNWKTEMKILGSNITVAENGNGEGKGIFGRTLEGVIPFGLGFDFRLSDHFALNLEGTLHGLNTDKLDTKVSGSKYDMYSYTSLGLTYKFSTGIKEPSVTKEVITEYKEEIVKPTVEPEVSIISEMPVMIYSGDEFVVNLIINKYNIKQSGKVIQYFPVGFLPSTTTLTNGDFNFEDQTLTISWDELPDTSIFTTSYKVLTDSLSTGNFLISGKFIYIYQNEEKFIDFENIIKIEQSEKLSKEQIEYQVGEEVVVIIPAHDIEYRVQIRAKLGKKLSNTWLANKYKLDQIIKEDFYNGYYIYTLGSFPTYEAAFKYRDELIATNKIYGSFVVGFKNGKRINIKELIIQETKAPIISVPDIEYRVQIIAKLNKILSTTILANKYNLNQNIKEGFHNGYYIYTIGSFPTYEAARRYRDELRSANKIYDAFVVAFREGKRYNTLSEINK